MRSFSIIKRCGVVIGLLLALIAGAIFSVVLQTSNAPTVGAQAQRGCMTFQATNQQVCGRFLDYWQRNGGLAQFGYPISPEFKETSDLNGQQYTVQYFERAVFEYHPENKAPYDVLLSQLGTYTLKQKYPQGVTPATSTSPTPTTRAGAGTPMPPGKGVDVPIGNGVVVRLIDQEQTAITGVATQNCGTEMTWVLQISNLGSAPFFGDIGRNSLKMTDNLGRSYPLSPNCGSLPYSGSFAAPATLVPGDTWKGYVAFEASDIPAAINYFDLHITISNTPVVFRYTLPGK